MNHLESVYEAHSDESIIDQFEHIVMEAQVSQETAWDFLIEKRAEEEQGEYLYGMD